MAGLIAVEYVTRRNDTQPVLFIHNKNNTTRTCGHWKCPVKACKGRASIVGIYVENKTPHNHPPDAIHIRFLSNIRKKSREETTAMLTLYCEELNKHVPEKIPTCHSIIATSFTDTDHTQYLHCLKPDQM